MRTFGTDAPDFFEFKIEGADEIYRIPLAGSLPVRWLTALQKADKNGQEESFSVQVEMLREYIGDVVDDVSAITLTGILQAWIEETNKRGASLGESSASSKF